MKLKFCVLTTDSYGNTDIVDGPRSTEAATVKRVQKYMEEDLAYGNSVRPVFVVQTTGTTLRVKRGKVEVGR